MSGEENTSNVSFEQVLSAEWKEIDRRRRTLNPRSRGDSYSDASYIVGLAFSGGGIRAAAFSLGAVHALSSIPGRPHHSLFERIDYISSVSGGSYAACSIAAKMIQDGIRSPLSAHDDPHTLRYLSHVRTHSKFLSDHLAVLLNWLY